MAPGILRRIAVATCDHSTFVVDTHVGGFNFIPAQADRSVDAEPGLAWDRTGGPHNGRVYLVYTLEQKNGSDDTDIYVRYSDDDGATWSAGVRVNDDNTENSQFLPKISLDPTTGNLAVIWYDARNDLGTGGPGDTDGVPNTDAQVWGAFSIDGGATFTRNIQISAGTSNSRLTSPTAPGTLLTAPCTNSTSTLRVCRCPGHKPGRQIRRRRPAAIGSPTVACQRLKAGNCPG